MEFRCPYCEKKSKSRGGSKVFDSLGELGTHLSKMHGLDERKKRKLYRKMGWS